MLRAQQAQLANQVQQEQAAIAALNEAMGGAIKGLLGGIGGAYDQVSASRRAAARPRLGR